jgi:hypothetical protein
MPVATESTQPLVIDAGGDRSDTADGPTMPWRPEAALCLRI